MASLTILSTGLCDRIVDSGRPQARSLGLEVGGAADRFSLAIGNALVGNPPEAAAIEATLHGPTVVADEDLACAVFGASFDLRLNGIAIATSRSFTLRAGQKLQMRGAISGARAYLCVQGELQAPVILGSRSGLEPLQKGAVLPCRQGSIHSRFVASAFEWNREPLVLRVLPGGQREWFPADCFDGQIFTISNDSNRMGLRLEGPRLSVADREMVSEPVCPGSVQVTREGQCIILGCDGQTMGGYPKVAQVASVDLDKTGQLRPGDKISFQWVELSEAEQLFHQKQAELEEWLLRLQTTA